MGVPLPFADRTLSADRQLLVELTKRCHCACAHCYTNAGPGVRTAEPSAAEIGVLVDSARRLGLRAATLSGGELMLRPDIDAVIDALPAGIDVWLFTSGLHVGFDRLLRWQRRVCGYVVSLDGSASRHDWLRRLAGSFDQNVAFLKRLAAAGCRAQIQSMVLRVDDDHLEPVVRLAEAVGVERILFSHVSPDGRGLALAACHMTPDELEALDDRVARLQEQTPVRLRTNLMRRDLVASRFPEMALHVPPTGEVLPWFGASATFSLARLDEHGWDLERAIVQARCPEPVIAAFARARAAALAYEGAAVPVDDLLVRELGPVITCA